jgi:predicted alpha/beta-fold hydrolase
MERRMHRQRLDHGSHTQLSAVLALALTGCVGTQLMQLDNVDLHLPPADPRGNLRSELTTLFAQYERAPVLSPEDARLEPLLGALTTLSYFGAEVTPRVLDQQIPASADDRAHGQTLETSCAAFDTTSAELGLATTGVPAFTPVWIPLATRGGLGPRSSHCDEHGQPSDDATFCAFARLALQPGQARSLIVVVHGLFDSGAQRYVQQMAALLYRQGHSVLVPDMRDHGDTLRAAPTVATTLGNLEGLDVLGLVAAAREACGARIGRAGVAGVSGGGLDAIRAFTLDQQASLDAGVIAVSPLLDVDAVVRDLSRTGSCPATTSIELGFWDDVALGVACGLGFFAGAATVQGLSGHSLDANTAISAGIGAGVGLVAGFVADAVLDGGSDPCVANNMISHIVNDALHVRWRTLRKESLGQTLSPAGRRIAPEQSTLEDYVRERVNFRASQLRFALQRFDAASLAHELRSALQPRARSGGRLLVLGADDDPMTRKAAFDTFRAHSRGLAQLYVHSVRHGGHAAMWVVQPTVMEAIFQRFFSGSEARGAQRVSP